jgi:hypothetical protein
MLCSHASVTKLPVRESQVPTHSNAEVAHLDPERRREVGQSRLPYATPCGYSRRVEWGIDAENNNVRGIVEHQSVNIFGALSTRPISNDLLNLSFVVWSGIFGFHTPTRTSMLPAPFASWNGTQ